MVVGKQRRNDVAPAVEAVGKKAASVHKSALASVLYGPFQQDGLSLTHVENAKRRLSVALRMQVQQGTDQQKQAPGDKQTFPDSGESGTSREKGQRNACGG